MRVSREEKDRSHDRIVAAAARRLRERGIDGTRVADVMSEAGLTHGGFYRHFETKDALTEAALGAAFAEVVAWLDCRLGAAPPRDVVAAFQARYLSPVHLENPASGCPIPALASEIGRGSAPLKIAFGKGVGCLIARIAAGLPGAESRRRVNATRALAMMAGAVMIARASDPATAAAVLAACQPKPEGATTAT